MEQVGALQTFLAVRVSVVQNPLIVGIGQVRIVSILGHHPLPHDLDILGLIL